MPNASAVKLDVRFERNVKRYVREAFAESLDDLAARYLETLDSCDEVEMYLTPQEYAELILCLGGGWYEQQGFIEWVKQDVLGEQERQGGEACSESES